MSPLERLLAEREQRNKRVANWITALILLLVGAAVLAVCLLYHPERAGAKVVKCSAPQSKVEWDRYKLQSARKPKLREVVKVLQDGRVNPCRAKAAFYNHIADCKLSLRGYYSDDDVHTLGVATGAKSFNGWGASGHYSDGSAYVWGYFEYSYNYTVLYKGRCSGGDYVSDWFAG